MSTTEQLPRPDQRPRRRLRAPARRPVRGAAVRAERTLGAIAEGRLGTLPVSLSFWDGSVLPAPDPDAPSIVIREPSRLGRVREHAA